MNPWLLLAVAIIGEVVATSALKATTGFSRLGPSVMVVLGYGLAFYCLSLILDSIPVGVAYAIWSGLGIVLVTAIAWWLYGQRLDFGLYRHRPDRQRRCRTESALKSQRLTGEGGRRR